MSTTSTLRDRCRTRFGDDGNVVSDSDWLTYLNMAKRWFDGASQFWPWNRVVMTVTVPPAGSVALPPRVTFVHWAGITLTNPRKLIPVHDRARWRSLEADVSSGDPIWYRIIGGTLYVLPTPTANTGVTLETTRPSPDLTYGGSDPAWPDLHDGVVTSYALYLAWLDDGNSGQSQAALAEAQDWLLRALQELRFEEDADLELTDTWWDVS